MSVDWLSVQFEVWGPEYGSPNSELPETLKNEDFSGSIGGEGGIRTLVPGARRVHKCSLQYDQVLFILEPTGIARSLAPKRVTVIDYPDGRLAIQ